MKKKVLGLVGSPRKIGNCEMLLKEVLLTDKDWEKEIIYLGELSIKSCKACYACLPQGAVCKEQDDLAFLLEKIREADGVVLAAPCYFLGPTAVVKNILDRFLAIANDQAPFRGKPCLTITTYGIPGWQGLAREYHNLFAHFLGLTLVDSILVQSSYPGEAFLQDPDLFNQLRKAGEKLFTPLKKIERPHTCPVCLSSAFIFSEEGNITCPFCGLQGQVKMEEGKLHLHFPDTTSHRFTPKEMQHHFQELLPASVQNYLAHRQEIKEIQKKYRQLDWGI